jgi:transposase, IS30 family
VRGVALTQLDRENISLGIAEGITGPQIAARLGRDRSVVYREITRCGGRDRYRAVEAQERAEAQAARPKQHKLAVNTRLHDAVNEGLAMKWSPEQISNRLKLDHPDDPEMRVSHETIYQTLFLQAAGTLKTELRIVLRSGRVRRRPAGSKPQEPQAIPDMVNISERPAEAADRAVPGHLEGDLMYRPFWLQSSTAALTRVRRKYGPSGYRLAHLDAGCAAAQLGVLGQALGLSVSRARPPHARPPRRPGIGPFPWHWPPPEATVGPDHGDRAHRHPRSGPRPRCRPRRPHPAPQLRRRRRQRQPH